MKLHAGLSKFEKSVVAVAILLGLVATLFLKKDFFAGDESHSKAPVVGDLTYFENDTRFKESVSFDWLKVKRERSVRVGDSLFTGASSNAHVQLKKGGVVDLGENSLVVFSEINGLKVPSLDNGNFRIRFAGTITLAIGQRLTTLRSDADSGSEVQVFLDKNTNKPVLKILKGKASFQLAKSSGQNWQDISLNSMPNENELMTPPQQNIRNVAQENPAVAPVAPPAPVQPEPQPVVETPSPAPVVAKKAKVGPIKVSRHPQVKASSPPQVNNTYLPPAKPAPQKRNIASTEAAPAASTMTTKVEGLNGRNRHFNSSRWEFEGLMVNQQSSQQINQGTSGPVLAGAGVRLHHWMNRNGIEAAIKASIFGLNSSASQSQPFDAEARYHRRIFFGPSDRYDLSLFGGLETYHNKSSTSFSNGYDILKIGSQIQFLYHNNWDMGGEVSVGEATAGGQKYEISGNFHYYITEVWSLGFGYRINAFYAGSQKYSPVGLPYREGYTEGFTTLRYHY